MTGTQKLLAIAGLAGAMVITFILISKPPEDPTSRPAAPRSSGAVDATSTTTTAIAPPSSVAPTASAPAPTTSGAPVDMATLAQEAKIVAEAREALAAGEPRKALSTIERWEKIPDRGALTPEATLVKIEALSRVGRKTDALALGMQTRDDPKLAPYQGRVDALLQDAGLIGEIQTPAPSPGR